MCTAISEVGKSHLFGRTLDLECSYEESVAIMPRGFELTFLHEKIVSDFAIIGACHMANGVPLFYDAVNEHGLCMAGLNFPNLAKYNEVKNGHLNVASYELIPFILRQCKDAKSAISLLVRTNVTNESFSPELKTTPLHWFLADGEHSYAIEPTVNGLEIHENPLRTLTNAPSFPFHLTNVTSFRSIGSKNKENTIAPNISLESFSGGMGAFGLPGDFSSASRLVRAFFAKNHTDYCDDEVGRFFSILNTVFIPLGCVKTDTGKSVCTIYSSCINATCGNYYFSIYGSKRIQCVRMNDVNLNASTIFSYPMTSCNECKFLN